MLVRGRGTVFSSGIDHSLLLEVTGAAARSPFLHVHYQLQDVFHRMSRLHQPVIAALHGVCVGMALELALAADLRLATEDCVLGLPEIAFGIVPDVGGTTRLVRAVGEPRARDLILTGRLVRARTARALRAHPRGGRRRGRARAPRPRARRAARRAPRHGGRAREVLRQISADADAATSFRLEGIVQQALFAQPELAARLPAALAFIKAQIAAAR